MQSFVDVDRTFSGQPRELGPLLSRIDTGKGREQLFQDQLPELLNQLSEDARIASITASNAIEGVIVEPDRAELLAEGSRRYRNRNEREFAGYRDATDELIRLSAREPLAVPFVLHLHRLLFAHVAFEPTPPDQTEFQLSELLIRYEAAQADHVAHPLVLIGALVLDFLAIHPVADGNGRLARLLTMHELLAHEYGIARYVSIEQRIYESKHAYYAALYESQRDWHQGDHVIWPWVTYLVRILASAYSDFEDRVSSARPQLGSKSERVREYVLEHAPETFRRRDIERALPGISDATVRLVLGELRTEGRIASEGAGRGSRWRRLQQDA